MCNLPSINKPTFYIFSRRDGIDKDDAPLYFCVLRIFDLAFLYVLPHINGRMIFPQSYTESISTDALKILGFDQEWVWESYDTTEIRAPHVVLDFSSSHIEKSSRKIDVSKLKRERECDASVDFPIPSISSDDIKSCNIKEVSYECISSQDLMQTSGNITTNCIFDTSAKVPLSLNLIIAFENIVNKKTLATVKAKITFHQNVYKGQYEKTEEYVSINQDLIVETLNLGIETLFKKLQIEYPTYPFTKNHLAINNVRELLSNMKVCLMEETKILAVSDGKSLWYSGY